MLPKRLLIPLGGCLLAASAAWADDVGYIDCSNHSEDTQVFGKARKTPEVVTSIPCGERFTILIYGFVFSRIETRDGKIGYVYSNLIAVDRSATSVQKAASPQIVAASARTPTYKPSTSETTATVAQPNPPAAAPSQNTVAQPVSVPPSATQPAPIAAPAQAAVPASIVPEKTAAVVQPDPPAPPQPQPARVEVFPTPPPIPISNSPETAAPAVQPDPPAPAQPAPAPPAQPEPAPARPAPAEAAAPAPSPAIRPADARRSWERPIPSARRAPRLELFGGYAFARLVGGGTSSNLNGAMGSFGWNVKSWLQIAGDSSYSFITVGSTKNVLYGNHFGPRYYYRRRNRWGLTPFVEGLVGGSRSDATISGTGGSTTSVNCISYKVGGGLDIHPSGHLEIRLFDVDFYRTAFGTNLHQNNYWVSTGIVIRLFGGTGVD
jgi:hypothetical protein